MGIFCGYHDPALDIPAPGLSPPRTRRRAAPHPIRRFFVRPQFMVGRARASSEGRFPSWPVVITRSRPATPIITRRQVSDFHEGGCL